MPRTVYNTTSVISHLPETKDYWKRWEKHVRIGAKQTKKETGKDRLVEVDFSVFNPKDYLLSHATIVAGVEPEKDYNYIVTPHGKYINDNGNGWFNQVLLETYTTFLMAYNFQEHIQIPVMAKGFVIDAVAWISRKNYKGEKEKIPTVYIDILVATHKKRHPDLIKDILAGHINTLSMGTEITHFQCSKCLKVFREDDDSPCRHVSEQLGSWFVGEDGKKHRVAEMCGVPGHPKTNIFIESSFVGVPAFADASRHSTLSVGKESSGRPLRVRIPRSRWKDVSERLKSWA